MKILIAEANKAVRQAIVSFFENREDQILKVGDPESYDVLLQHKGDLLVLDEGFFKDKTAIQLKKTRESFANLPILLIRSQFNGDDYFFDDLEGLEIIQRPVSENELKYKIDKLLDYSGKMQSKLCESGNYLELEQLPSFEKHPGMHKAIALLYDIAETDITVLISGESGVGKEIFAHHLHRYSRRLQDRFVGINCSSLPENLLEAELFGSEKGAYTGSVNKRLGKFEMAQKGTLLLDEISEMDINLQAKLLRVIQEKELYRVGGEKKIKLDVRLIATSNRDLKSWVQEGHFREDLYYRLNVIAIKVPPLRERLIDVPILSQFIVKGLNDKNRWKEMSLTESAISQLLSYSWPGNVRELENVLTRTFYLSPDSSIEKIYFEDEEMSSQTIQKVQTESQAANIVYTSPENSKVATISEMEREMIFRALELNNGNRVHASKDLGISVRTLRNKLKLYDENGCLPDKMKLARAG